MMPRRMKYNEKRKERNNRVRNRDKKHIEEEKAREKTDREMRIQKTVWGLLGRKPA